MFEPLANTCEDVKCEIPSCHFSGYSAKSKGRERPEGMRTNSSNDTRSLGSFRGKVQQTVQSPS